MNSPRYSLLEWELLPTYIEGPYFGLNKNVHQHTWRSCLKQLHMQTVLLIQIPTLCGIQTKLGYQPMFWEPQNSEKIVGD